MDAIVHLAELSNDPLGNTVPKVTKEINHRGSVRLAKLAKEAGVPRFVYTSSCSVYGAGTGDFLDETAPVNPQTAYAECKVMVERDVGALADDSFSPVFLRNATAYGASPRMRFDIVLNNLSGLAWVTKRIAMTSDGTPWRPLVHVLDICHAVRCAVEAPAEAIHNQIFNVGQNSDNYRVREIAEDRRGRVPGMRGDLRQPRWRQPKLPRRLRQDSRASARVRVQVVCAFGRQAAAPDFRTDRDAGRDLRLSRLHAVEAVAVLDADASDRRRAILDRAMKMKALDLPDAVVVELEPHVDERGFFARTWCSREFCEAGVPSAIVQTNLSQTRQRGAIRGLHYQRPPSREGKIVRCIEGGIFDVIVDVRPDSPAFLKHAGVELTPSNRLALYIPPASRMVFRHSSPTPRSGIK